MKRANSSSPFFIKRASIVSVLALVIAVMVFSAWVGPANAALNFPVYGSVQINTATGSQLFPGFDGGSCTFQNYIYGYWVDSSQNLWVASSSDGVVYAAPQNLTKLSGMGTFTTSSQAGQLPYKINCASNVLVAVWMTANAGAIWTGAATNFIKYTTGSMSGGVVTMSGVITTGPKTANGFNFKASATNVAVLGCVGYYNNLLWYCIDATSVASQFTLVQNNVISANTSAFGGNSYMQMAYSGSAYMVLQPKTCQYTTSPDGTTWSAVATFSATYCAPSEWFVGGLTATGNNFYWATGKNSNQYVLKLSNTGTLVTAYTIGTATGSAGMSTIETDNQGNFVAIMCAAGTLSTCNYWYTLNSWVAFTGPMAFVPTGAQFGGGSYFYTMGSAQYFSPTMEIVPIETANQGSPFAVYETMIGTPLTTPAAASQTFAIGSCPSKNTATTTLVNNTEYFYTGGAISGANIQTVSTFVAHVTSAATPQTLSLGIYATQSAGPVSASNTFFLIAAYSKSLTAGTVNNAINWSPGVSLSGTIIGNIPTGATIGVAILGTNKIQINQSSLAGMTTGSTSGGVLAGTFTSLATNAAQLYLCMNLNYQSVVTTTTTVTSTTTTTTTSTSNVAGQVNPTVLANSNFMLAIIVILGPSLILAAATKSLWGGILGALLGGAAGAFIGFLPFWVPVVIVIGCITILFFARGGGGDKM